MTQEQLVGIIIVAVIDLPLIVISIVLMMGRGSDFIAGINTMSHREKEKYDLPALCRSVGRFTLIAGLLMPTVVFGGICAAIFIAYTVIGAIVCYKAQHGRKVQTLNTFNTLLRGNHMANSTRMGRINDDIQLALSSLLRQVKDRACSRG